MPLRLAAIEPVENLTDFSLLNSRSRVSDMKTYRPLSFRASDDDGLPGDEYRFAFWTRWTKTFRAQNKSHRMPVSGRAARLELCVHPGSSRISEGSINQFAHRVPRQLKFDVAGIQPSHFKSLTNYAGNPVA